MVDQSIIHLIYDYHVMSCVVGALRKASLQQARLGAVEGWAVRDEQQPALDILPDRSFHHFQ